MKRLAITAAAVVITALLIAFIVVLTAETGGVGEAEAIGGNAAGPSLGAVVREQRRINKRLRAAVRRANRANKSAASIRRTIAGLSTAQGAQGPTGVPGPQGTPGAAGPQGPSHAYFRERTSQVQLDASETVVLTLDLPSGAYVARSGTWIANTSITGTFKNATCRMIDPGGAAISARVDIDNGRSGVVGNGTAFETSGGTLTVSCALKGPGPNSGFVPGAWIQAVEMADLTIVPPL